MFCLSARLVFVIARSASFWRTCSLLNWRGERVLSGTAGYIREGRRVALYIFILFCVERLRNFLRLDR